MVGVLTVNCFHIYKKKKHYIANISDFIKISIRGVILSKIKLKKKKFKSILILTKYKFSSF